MQCTLLKSGKFRVQRLLANQMFWDICSKRPNVLGQDLTEEDNRAKKCFDKLETESEIIV